MEYDETPDIKRSLGRLINRIQNREIVQRMEIKRYFSWILSQTHQEANFFWGALFSALQTRGVSKDELLGLLDAATDFDPDLVLPNSSKRRLLDDRKVVAITGSGKDNYKTFNISTATAFVVASLGVCTIKPGSSALSSTSGAIDILLPLGIGLVSRPEDIVAVARETNLCIFSFSDVVGRYASRYHDLFYSFHPLSYIMPVVAIPYRVDAVLYGIANSDVELTVGILAELNYPRAAVVSTEIKPGAFTDELIPFGVTRAAVIEDRDSYTQTYKSPWIVGDDEGSLAPGFSHEENAEILRRVLRNRRGRAATRAVARNAGMLLYLAGTASTPLVGMQMAEAALADGQAADALTRYAEMTQMLAEKTGSNNE